MLIAPTKHLPPDVERYRRRATTQRIIIHRTGLGTRAADIVAGFTGGVPEAAKATGGKMPYHFVVEPDGKAVQCLPVGVMAPHAWKWNDRTVAVACSGDFRRHEPPQAQWYAAARLCRSLEMMYRADTWGHDELPDGSKDPEKQCPGGKWDIPFFLGAIRHLAITGADVVNFERHLVL
jgi:hypothetical protein